MSARPAPAAVRAHVEDLPAGSFVTAADVNGFDVRSVGAALARLVAAGELVRVHRGIYYKGVSTRYGMTHPDVLELTRVVLAQAGITAGFGPAGVSAVRQFGLSTQVPSYLEVAVSGRTPAAPEGVQFVRRPPHGRSELGWVEVACLEMLSTWPRFSERSWKVACDRVRETVHAGRLDLDAVVAATVGGPAGIRVRALMMADDVSVSP